mgnify:CR=1 FL=1
MIVTFCGHREIANVGRVREWLNKVCIQLIDDGASEFFLGGYGAFDRLCADVLRGLKGRFRHIRLVLVLPYPGRDMTKPSIRRWNPCRDDTLFCAETNGWFGAAT